MAANLTIQEVLQAVEGKPLGELNQGFLIRGVSTDTRALEKDNLFIALEGPQFDGHDFIEQALDKGVKNCVVSNVAKVLPSYKKRANFIGVGDTLKAYGDLAAAYRKRFKIPVVAITGSSGKTSVKEMTAHLLSPHFKVLKNRGTENNLVGVPKTIFCLEKSHEVLVLELGTNRPGEIDRLASILTPQIGVITQIGLAHLEGLGSREGVREEKLALVEHLQNESVLFLNGEDPMLREIQSGRRRLMRVGFSKATSNFYAEEIRCHAKGSAFTVSQTLFQTQLFGRHNVLNCLLAIAVVRSFGIEWQALQQRLQTFEAVPGRLCKRTIEAIHFLDDSYNSNPNSFCASIETLKQLNVKERKGVVCGDMLELGKQSEACHRQIGALIAEQFFDYVIAAGPWSKYLVDEAFKNGFDSKRIYHVTNSLEAGKLCREIAEPGDWVLVKGSRGTQMEKVFECFITSSTH